MSATRYHDLPSPYTLYRGGQLHGARLAYETWGELDADHGNAVLILTGLSPGAHAASSAADPSQGWWEAMDWQQGFSVVEVGDAGLFHVTQCPVLKGCMCFYGDKLVRV